MERTMTALWEDDDGALIATEYMFIAVISVIGLVVGLTYIRDATTAKLSELSQAVLFLDVGYQFPAIQGAYAGLSTRPFARANGSYVINTPHTGDFIGTSAVTTPPQDIQSVPATPYTAYSAFAQ